MKNKIIKKTVTIGIPAHNEEKNIASLLNSILLQKGDNFKIDNIVVTCDGCTDNTPKIVNDFCKKYSLIKLINDEQRLGKNARLNRLYKDLISDIFISFDADIMIRDINLISKIVAAFDNEKIGLVGGQVIHVSRNNFVGKSLLAQEFFWSEVVMSINNGNNVHSHTGPISAARKEFIKKILIPEELPDDHFVFFKAMQNGFKYRYVKQAEVYIKIPATFDDYMRQSTRFLNSAENIREYFGNWVEKYYYVPYSKKLRAYVIIFIKNPVYLPFALILVALQRILSFKYVEKHNVGIWSIIQTSK